MTDNRDDGRREACPNRADGGPCTWSLDERDDIEYCDTCDNERERLGPERPKANCGATDSEAGKVEIDAASRRADFKGLKKHLESRGINPEDSRLIVAVFDYAHNAATKRERSVPCEKCGHRRGDA